MLSALLRPLQEPEAEKLQLPNKTLSPAPLPFPHGPLRLLREILGAPEGPRGSGALLFSHREPPDSPELLAASDPQAPT